MRKLSPEAPTGTRARPLPFRGTVLNTLTVVAGSLIGLALRNVLPDSLLAATLAALGLVTLGMGVKLFLLSRNVLIVAGAAAFGVAIGTQIGIHAGLEQMAEGLKTAVGGQGTFVEGLVTASVLYCVGPMTLLGCVQDAVERKIDLLAVKSLMDGIASVFLAATLGVGVLFSALVVLIVQGVLTAAARKIEPLAADEVLMAEASATGGVVLMAIGLGLADIKNLTPANFLPALVLAPLFVASSRWIARLRSGSVT